MSDASSRPGKPQNHIDPYEGYFEFERPILDLKSQIVQLRELDRLQPELGLADQIERLETEIERLQAEVYRELSPWQKVLIARHPKRPRFWHYVHALCGDGFELLRGDRLYAEDPAIACVLGSIEGQTWAVIGHDRGDPDDPNDTAREGKARPEGFRKAMRVMKLAERFRLPVLTLVDTPGPDSGIEGESRGMAQTVAACLQCMAGLNTPVLSIVTGEGGSGGAIALALADRVDAQSNAIYSVISPEGCAAIIYRDASRAPEAAEQLRLTAEDLKSFGVIEGIIEEPLGGAHISPHAAAKSLREHFLTHSEKLLRADTAKLRDRRYQRFRGLGIFDAG